MTTKLTDDSATKKQIQLTQITSFSDVGKRYTKDMKAGKITKVTLGHIFHGDFEVKTIKTLADFQILLEQLSSKQVLTYGLPSILSGTVMTKQMFELLDEPIDAVTRSNKYFNWDNSYGIMMFDYDVPNSQQAIKPSKFINTLKKYIGDVDVLWCSSSSSFIYDGSKEVNGLRGQRAYIIVDKAKAIPDVAKIIHDRLCINGYGSLKVSVSGSLLERSLIDTAVYQASRIDFAAGAICVAPLIQKRQYKLYAGTNDCLKVSNIKKLTDAEIEQKNIFIAKEKVAKAPEVKRIKQQYVDRKVCEVLQRNPSLNPDVIRKNMKETLENDVLTAEFTLHVSINGKFQEVLVQDILSNPKKYHKAICLDPLEPSYDNYKPTGIIYTDNKVPILHSKARGERNFTLEQGIKVLPKPQKQTDIRTFDEPCGFGKSTGLIDELKYIKKYFKGRSHPMLIIVPYLSEIKRFINEVNDDNEFWLIEPEGIDGSKLEELQEALIQHKNIITTHKMYEFIRHFGHLLSPYDVLLDEVPITTQQIPIMFGKIGFKELIQDNYLTVNPDTRLMTVAANWREVVARYNAGDAKDRQIVRFLTKVANTEVYNIADAYCLMPIPNVFFIAPKSLTILTFLFEGTQLEKYMANQGYVYTLLPDKQTRDYNRKEFIIDMYTRMHLVFNHTKVSTGYEKMTGRSAQTRKTVSNYVVRTLKQLRKDNSIRQEDILVACHKDAWFGKEENPSSKVSDATSLKKTCKIPDATYTPIITRGTNKFSDKSVLLILGTENLHPQVAQFLGMNGKKAQTHHKTSELIQLIYRTRIRKKFKTDAEIADDGLITVIAADKEIHNLLHNFLDVKGYFPA